MTELEPRQVPGKVQAIGIMHLVGGILNVIASLVWGVSGVVVGIATLGIGLIYCCPALILLPIGVVEIISGARHLSKNHEGLKPPRLTGIVEIFAILGCGMFSTVFGILTLVFLSDPEVDEYYNQHQLPTY